MTLVSKNSCRSRFSSERVHTRFEFQTCTRNGELNCSVRPTFRREGGCRGADRAEIAAAVVGAADACDDTRGVATSGTGVAIDVMAREDESPCALDGE